MDWQSALTRLVGATAPIGEALQSGVVKSAREAFNHPTLIGVRTALVAELQRRSTLAEIFEASSALRRQHEELALKSELSLVELQRLGVLSGMALALSCDALAKALSEQDLFDHAVTQIRPWLDRGVACGIVHLPKPVQALVGKTCTIAAEVTKKSL